MKYIKIFLPILFLTFLSQCEFSNQEFTAELLSSSECKLFEKSIDTTRNYTCIQYEYSLINQTLTLTHVNAGFNCCPEKIYIEYSSKNNEITIEEFEKESLCNCACLFDLEIEITNLTQGKYNLTIIEPYNYEEPVIKFGINLDEENSGLICYERLNYPWGIFK